MAIKLEQVKGKEQISILSIQGDLDASNYKEVINIAKKAHEDGARFLLIDMSEMSFMSSSGLIALHSIALLMRGEEPSDLEYGWEAIRSLDRDRDSGKQENIKLLNPQPKIAQSLEITGLKEFFEIHTDLDTAIASFK
jgi:anti-anti-sigma regulatory factor